MTEKVVLQTEGLTKSYGPLIAVKNLSLEVYEGEVFGFLGPNGAGKTTSINLMCGLLKPEAGRVMIHGQAIRGGETRFRARVGVCPQEIVIWEKLTCLEQLEFMGRMYGVKSSETRQRGERLLYDLDLAEKKNQEARKLSGGMKRRLNLALALVHDPELVVLDEPEAGLDPQSRVKVREYLQSLARRKTVIITTHNMDEADRLADRVAIIDHGELLVLDTPEALKKSMGEGDVLEISLRGAREAIEKAPGVLAPIVQKVALESAANRLTIRAHHAVGVLPMILSQLTSLGLRCEEVRLRENTLEDVFIHLTGRRLRE